MESSLKFKETPTLLHPSLKSMSLKVCTSSLTSSSLVNVKLLSPISSLGLLTELVGDLAVSVVLVIVVILVFLGLVLGF